MNAIPIPAGPDLVAVKARQQGAWSSGDYAIVGTTLQLAGEQLCEAMDLRAGSKVLDVAAGNGNVTLAAARRWCDVVSTDYVPALLERGRERAQAERLPVEFRQADAEALPVRRRELRRRRLHLRSHVHAGPGQGGGRLAGVCRPGGRIGLANWTPDGFIGQLFRTIGGHLPPPAGVRSPALWGTEARIAEMFGEKSQAIAIERRSFVFRYRSREHWLEVFRTYYGPVLKAFGALEAPAQAALAADLLALVARFNRATDGTMVVPSDYLEIVVTR